MFDTKPPADEAGDGRDDVLVVGGDDLGDDDLGDGDRDDDDDDRDAGDRDDDDREHLEGNRRHHQLQHRFQVQEILSVRLQRKVET